MPKSRRIEISVNFGNVNEVCIFIRQKASIKIKSNDFYSIFFIDDQRFFFLQLVFTPDFLDKNYSANLAL